METSLDSKLKVLEGFGFGRDDMGYLSSDRVYYKNGRNKIFLLFYRLLYSLGLF